VGKREGGEDSLKKKSRSQGRGIRARGRLWRRISKKKGPCKKLLPGGKIAIMKGKEAIRPEKRTASERPARKKTRFQPREGL